MQVGCNLTFYAIQNLFQMVDFEKYPPESLGFNFMWNVFTGKFELHSEANWQVPRLESRPESCGKPEATQASSQCPVLLSAHRDMVIISKL